MKKLFLSFALFAAFSTAVFANTGAPSAADTKEVRKEVVRLIQTPELAKNGIKSADVFIKFTVEDDGTINVLKVKTDNEYLKNFITEQLDEQQLDVKSATATTDYNIKIAFQSEI